MALYGMLAIGASSSELRRSGSSRVALPAPCVTTSCGAPLAPFAPWARRSVSPG